MTPKEYYSWDLIDIACRDIYKDIRSDKWQPDLVIGLTRGGLIPATILSHRFNVPMETLKISLRDHKGSEDSYKDYGLPDKNILIVDDINDSGATIAHLKQVWEQYFPKKFKWDNFPAVWDEVWHKKVRFATIVDNISSQSKVDYRYTTINKADKDVWIVYPWEIETE
jgi:hypoxanthine phosphoribosyltransferase